MLKLNNILRYVGLRIKCSFLTIDASPSTEINLRNPFNIIKNGNFGLAIEPDKFGKILFLRCEQYDITN